MVGLFTLTLAMAMACYGRGIGLAGETLLLLDERRRWEMGCMNGD